MYEYDDGEEGGGRPVGRLVAMVAGVLILALLGWFVVKPRLDGDDAGGESVSQASVATSVATGDSAAAGADGTGGSGAITDDTSATTDGPTTTAGREITDGPTTTRPSPTTLAPSTTQAPAPTTTAAPATVAVPTYDTLPDGSPVPVLALYGTDNVTLTGAVPDEAAKTRLGDLALANAKPEQANLDNQLTIDPTVPRNIGVRVVELTSVRFPEGSADVLPPHAAELNRVATIMNALPNLTVLVIGHADQRGDELTNFAISEDRADSVVNYLAAQGVAPSRMASRAVGEADLLTLDNEPAALALNRRTEFVLYGLLLP